MSEWTTDKPAESGWYWVWGRRFWIGDEREKWSSMYCVEVGIKNDNVWFHPHVEAWDYDLELKPEEVEYWLGPIDEPEPPETDE